jgi:multiple sugar transport system ATP-binding protein
MASVVYDAITKTYPDGTTAVNGLDLAVRDGEFMVLVGPSGCGKTTALRMCAGLEEVTRGELRIDDRVINDVDPQKRDIAMVFQNYALYPHMTVFDNIAFPLASQGMRKAEIKERVTTAATKLGLRDQLKRKPRNLSGGQRQRVAMGRAIVRQPKVFLMDEPLSNLDAKLRVQMRAEISRLQHELGTTTIYVTHDQVEAMTMGDRIAVLRKGVLQQAGSPQDLYDHPDNLFVATFVGSPAMNLMLGTIEKGEGGDLAVRLGNDLLALPDAVKAARPRLRGYLGRQVCVGVRPEHLIDGAVADAAMPRLSARVRLVETLGAQKLIHLELGVPPVVTDAVLEVAGDVDEALVQDLRYEEELGETIAIAAFDSGSRTEVGDRQPVGVPVEHIHFFDLDSGVSIR